MRIGDFEIEADVIGWKVYRHSKCVKSGSAKGRPQHMHYFGRLDHVAAWMADEIARELAPACRAVEDLTAALRCWLNVVSEPVAPVWSGEFDGKQLPTKVSRKTP